MKLNANEIRILNEVNNGIQRETAGDFGYFDSIEIPSGMTINQVKGYVADLQKKGLIYVDDQFGQIIMTELGSKTLHLENDICAVCKTVLNGSNTSKNNLDLCIECAEEDSKLWFTNNN